jgi:hypothetical protein
MAGDPKLFAKALGDFRQASGSLYALQREFEKAHRSHRQRLEENSQDMIVGSVATGNLVDRIGEEIAAQWRRVLRARNALTSLRFMPDRPIRRKSPDDWLSDILSAADRLVIGLGGHPHMQIRGTVAIKSAVQKKAEDPQYYPPEKLGLSGPDSDLCTKLLKRLAMREGEAEYFAIPIDTTGWLNLTKSAEKKGVSKSAVSKECAPGRALKWVDVDGEKLIDPATLRAWMPRKQKNNKIDARVDRQVKKIVRPRSRASARIRFQCAGCRSAKYEDDHPPLCPDCGRENWELV